MITRSSRSQRWQGQQGSLPLVLLVTIIVGGIVVVLVARTMTAQNQVRFDQTYHGALPGADSAVEISKSWLNGALELERDDGDESTTDMLHPRNFEVGDSTVLFEDEVDGRSFSWTMTKASAMSWRVDATATDPRTDVERRVVATLDEAPLVDVAAFADVLLALSGANRTDSYNSMTKEWCTGRGWVASNNDVTFTGGGAGPGPWCFDVNPPGMQARTVDQVLLYDWEDNPGNPTSDDWPGGERCDDDKQNHANCTEVNGYPAPARFLDRLELAVDKFGEDFIKQALDACEGPLEEFRASTWTTDDGILEDAGNLTPAEDAEAAIIGPEFDLEGGHYCFERMVFDQDVNLSESASRDNPVIVFVEQDILVEGHTHVGCPIPGTPQAENQDPGSTGCVRGPDEDEETYPEAGALIIFVLEGPVTLSQHSAFAGVAYAPVAPCGGGGGGGPGGGGGGGAGGGAQADVYGSIICKTLEHAGGWRFHYDEALGELGSGQFGRGDWREVPS